jgi:hypothetical protein
LPAGAAADYVSACKHRTEFAIALATRQRLSRSEEKDEVGVGIVGEIAGSIGPAGALLQDS